MVLTLNQDRDRGCCNCCLGLIFAAAFTSLLLWLGIRRMRPNDPKCSIDYFYVPSLNKTLNTRLNTTLNFMVRLDNPNSDQGIYYDDVHLSFSNSISSSIANYTVPPFYQGLKKKAKKWGQVLPLNNQTVLGAVFRLDLKTQVRFKIAFWKTKRYGIEVGADVEVNEDGAKTNNKGIKMKKSDSSSSSSLRNYFPVCVLMNVLVFFAICYTV